MIAVDLGALAWTIDGGNHHASSQVRSTPRGMRKSSVSLDMTMTDSTSFPQMSIHALVRSNLTPFRRTLHPL